MTEDEYIKTRLDDQIAWYSDKSSHAQKWYKYLSWTTYICAGLTSLLALFIAECIYTKYIVAFLGIAIGIIGSAQNLHKYHDNWISYRYTSELLKQEKYMYLNKAGVFDIEDPAARQKLLVERCETIISHETINWTNLNVKEDKAKA